MTWLKLYDQPPTFSGRHPFYSSFQNPSVKLELGLKNDFWGDIIKRNCGVLQPNFGHPFPIKTVGVFIREGTFIRINTKVPKKN